jgi:hypothetical protein
LLVDSALPRWAMDLHKSGQARKLVHGLWRSVLAIACVPVRSSAGAILAQHALAALV